jgi:hypothetical protein
VLRTARPTQTDVLLIVLKPTITIEKEEELKFALAILNIAPSSVIVFNFLSLNYTLTKSKLADLCRSNSGFNTSFT